MMYRTHISLFINNHSSHHKNETKTRPPGGPDKHNIGTSSKGKEKIGTKKKISKRGKVKDEGMTGQDDNGRGRGRGGGRGGGTGGGRGVKKQEKNAKTFLSYMNIFFLFFFFNLKIFFFYYAR